jgi:hypothetical protein
MELSRTLIPGYLYRFSNKKYSGIRICFEPQTGNRCTEQATVPLVESSYCKGAFDLMGWEKLPPSAFL